MDGRRDVGQNNNHFGGPIEEMVSDLGRLGRVGNAWIFRSERLGRLGRLPEVKVLDWRSFIFRKSMTTLSRSEMSLSNLSRSTF